MFLNKSKEQLGPEKAGAPSFPHSSASSTSSPHYPTAVLAIPGSVEAGPGVRVVPKQEGGGGHPAGGGGGGGNSGSAPLSVVGGHLHQSHTSQNITVVPVPSTGIMTAGGWAFMSFFFMPESSPIPPHFPFLCSLIMFLYYCFWYHCDMRVRNTINSQLELLPIVICLFTPSRLAGNKQQF